jgi:hypothetical protein
MEAKKNQQPQIEADKHDPQIKQIPQISPSRSITTGEFEAFGLPEG